jgi:hypothetical protein
MKKILKQLTVLLALLAMPFLTWGQCSTCPTNGSQCLSPFCCIATGGTNTLDNCIANGATTVIVSYYNATISSGTDASGVHFCFRSTTDINFAGDVLVDNETCFTSVSNGNIVFIGGTALAFQGPAEIGLLNNEIANIPPGMSVTISSIMNALPVELISFTGKSTESGAQLEWITATETDNDYFLLEYSADAKTFEFLATIPAQLNGSQQQQYQYLDKSTKPGVNYYRLWQYDLDGTKNNLGIVEVTNHNVNGESVRITPNPVVVGDRITLSAFDFATQPNVSFTLVNSMGQSWPLAPEGETLVIPSQLSNGLYYLIITQSSTRELLPLVVIE